jgi:hypothetical protein
MKKTAAAVTAALVFMAVSITSIFYFISSDKGLDFLANVTGLDVSSYSVRVRTAEQGTNEKTVKYELTSGNDRIDALTIMREGKIVWCKLYAIKGAPRFNEPAPANPLIGSKNLLEKLKHYFADSYVPAITDEVLNLNVGQDGSFSAQAGTDVTIQLTVQGNMFNFMWSYTPKGIENTYKTVALSTENGRFQFYGNNWDIYQIGNADANINSKQAIQIAKEKALEEFSFLQPTQIKDQNAMAKLSMQQRGNYTLYPQWNILLPVDTAYGGAVRVLIWADIGNVSYIQGELAKP